MGDELRKGIVSCYLIVGSVSRCCFRNESGSVAGAVHGDDVFVAGRRQDVVRIGATLKKRWETRDPIVGAEPGGRKELHILNRTLRWGEDGIGLRREFETCQRSSRRTGTEQVKTRL